MDGQRFDELARRIAVGRSRRTVLRNVAGGLITLAGVSVGSRPTRAATCSSDGDCTGCEACIDGVCTLTCIGSQVCCQVEAAFACADCCSDGDCAEGQVCADGACVVPPCATDADCPSCKTCNADTGVCVGGCEPGEQCCAGVCAGCCHDSDCGFSDDYNCVNGVCVPQTCAGEYDSCHSFCCWGLICVSDGLYCARYACQTDDDCAGVYIDDIRPCILGVCTGRLSGIGQPCETDAHCDLAWCAAGVCAALGVEGDACARDAQCATGRCLDDVCVHECIRKGHTCHVDVDCCEGLVCADRLCVVPEEGGNGDSDGEPEPEPEPGEVATTLPATGSGQPGGTDHTMLFGAGFVTAAAALVATRRLGPTSER
jgi:hypothetical protein